MSSGCDTKPECKSVFDNMKKEKTFQYLIFKITSDKRHIEIEHKGSRGASFEDFADKFPDGECRYGVIAVPQGSSDKMVFVAWSDDEGASTKAKMLYASCKDCLLKTLKDGLHEQYQAVQRSDLDSDEMAAKAEKV